MPRSIASNFRSISIFQRTLTSRFIQSVSLRESRSTSPIQNTQRMNPSTSPRTITAAVAAGKNPSADNPASTTTKLVLVVAVAFLDSHGRVLLAERPAGKSMAGLYEFPGGKVEPGETPEAALVRELQEELGVTIDLETCFPITFASHSYENFHLLMPLYECTRWDGDFCSKEGQKFEWVDAEKLLEVPMPEADYPLLPAVLQAMRKQATTEATF